MTIYRSGNLQFDTHVGRIQNAAGESLRLSPILLKLLLCLLDSNGQVVTRTQLFDRVWPHQMVNDDVLTRAISDLRTQVAKLDASEKYVETIPRRGYRWLLPVESASALASDQIAPVAVYESIALASPTDFLAAPWMKRLIGYLVGASFLAVSAMLLIEHFAAPVVFNIAVLPAQAEYPGAQQLAQHVDEVLGVVLRKQSVNLLSKSAVASRPMNPFPYFYKEFNTRFVLESRVSNSEGLDRVELSLVDARRGIELRSLRVEAANNTELTAKLAKVLDVGFFAEEIPY